ncbi:MAG: signal transduction histidine kinase [Cyclobacteriaceae bacterium]|jgi:signal transduction histidine kinase
MKNAGALPELLSNVLFDRSQDGLLLLDREGRLIKSNKMAQQLLDMGQPLESGMMISELIPELNTKLINGTKSYINQKPEIRRLGVNNIKVSITIHFEKDAGIFMIVLSNLSMVEEILQTKDLLDEAEDLAHMGSFELNLKTFQSKQSKGILKLVGLSSDVKKTEYKPFMDYIHPADNEKEKGILENFIQGAKYQEWDRSIVRLDGGKRLFQVRARMIADENGIPEKIIGVNLDVTETRLNERLQLESVIKAQEDLRHQLALEIHDGLGPMLAGSKLFLEKISDKIDETILPEYNENLETLADVHKGLRNLSHRLVPKSLYDFGLAVGIEALCDKMEDATNLEINFRNEGANSLLKGDFALNLYRISQELINNIINHAKASKVNIQLIGRKNQLTLVVQDNGVGMRKNEKDIEGIGLLNVKSRVKVMNGKLHIKSSSGFGTVITIKVPLK